MERREVRVTGYSTVTRGKVKLSTISGRTILQVTGLDNEVFANIELLLPFGIVASPTADSDVLLMQVNNQRSHVVALGSDNLADAQTDLQPGEMGMRVGNRMVLLRLDHTLVQDPNKIVLQAPELYWSPDGTAMHRLATDTHTHNQPSDGAGDAEEPTDTPNTVTGMLTG